jgi:polar amino acid transport system substrate-binding protein
MEIQQAVGTTRTRRDETLGFLRRFVEELKADGFIAEALRRSGRPDATVAPPDTTVARKGGSGAASPAS